MGVPIQGDAILILTTGQHMISEPIFSFPNACAGVEYPIAIPPELVGLPVVGFVAGNPLPAGVSADDIKFTNPNGQTSGVTFPKEGCFFVCVKYWEPQ